MPIHINRQLATLDSNFFRYVDPMDRRSIGNNVTAFIPDIGGSSGIPIITDPNMPLDEVWYLNKSKIRMLPLDGRQQKVYVEHRGALAAGGEHRVGPRHLEGGDLAGAQRAAQHLQIDLTARGQYAHVIGAIGLDDDRFGDVHARDMLLGGHLLGGKRRTVGTNFILDLLLIQILRDLHGSIPLTTLDLSGEPDAGFALSTLV